MNQDQLQETLESQIAFESQRQPDEVWTPEYLAGYIDGLKQAVAVISENK